MVSGKRRKLYGKVLSTGIVSIASYLVLYTHQEWVTRTFTRGGVYAVFPIATAFYFSFVHGAFTSCVLQMLGLRSAERAAGPGRAGNAGEKEA